MFDDFEDTESDELFSDAKPRPAEPSAPALQSPRANDVVLGHDAQEQAILSLFNKGNLPHAMIFAGQKGIGKSTFAFRLARFLLKHGGDDAGQDSLFGDAPANAASFDVSPDDPVSHKVASGGHPDLLTVERPMDERKGTQKDSVDVESVRSIAPFLRMTSSDGGWRIVIVDDAETMNRNAQNAILKILEEPPEKSLLILICHRLGAMIPTIRSRCRTFMFHPLDADNLAKLLERGIEFSSTEKIKMLTDMANGSIGHALEIDEAGGLEFITKVIGLLGSFPAWDWTLIHNTADNLGRFGASDAEYRNFEGILIWICESLLLAKAAGPSKLPEILRDERLDTLLNHYSLEQWIDICEKLNSHFTAVDVSNLDKRQGVLGAFALLG